MNDAVEQLCCSRLGLLLVVDLFGLLDQREHVAHAEDARRHPLRVEHIELVDALPETDELDRLPGHLASRDRSTAAGVAVELGEHQAGQVGVFEEAVRNVDGFLTGHRIEHEQHLVGRRSLPDGREFLHQVLVDLEPAGGVDDHDVGAVAPGLLECRLHEPRRLGLPVDVDRHVDPLAERLELVDRRRALEVGRHEQRALPLALQVFGELGCGRRLAGALEPDHEDHERRGGRANERNLLGAEGDDQLLVDDLDDLLARGEALRDLGCRRPVP